MGTTRLAKVFAVGAFVLLVAGCDEHITDAVIVKNDTTAPVHFTIDLVDGRSFDLPVTAAPGASVRLLDGSQLSDGAGITRERCTVGELRAIGPDGTIVDRLPPPICAPTTVVVDGMPSPS
ncbi:MAG TPA: hypothetical protein VFN41_08535 [Candidatus Limnocylindrales bacterium]|nr:hypothetical protein [Candidatus Limnocylindrales bacterium]